MSTYQKYIVIGHLGRDPELRSAQSGTTMANFSLAVEAPRKGSDSQAETVWFDVTAFGKLAEVCKEYLNKGSKVLVEGKWNPPRTFDKRDGSVGVSLPFWAERVVFQDARRADEDGETTDSARAGEEEALPF